MQAFWGMGQGCVFGGQTEHKQLRVCRPRIWGQALPGWHTWVQAFWGVGQGCVSAADRTQNMAGKGYGLDRLLVWGGFPKGGAIGSWAKRPAQPPTRQCRFQIHGFPNEFCVSVHGKFEIHGFPNEVTTKTWAQWRGATIVKE